MHTLDSLTDDLRMLALPAGGIWLLHSGYRSLGPVDGGPDTVIAALRRALGEASTLAAPTFTTNLTDPYTWPATIPAEQRERLLSEIPCFDAKASPPHRMGAIATALWKTPGALRSDHPVTSWAAIGPEAATLLQDHDRDDPEGLHSPIGRAWRMGGRVLLLGVDHDANTTIHLAESLLDMPHLRVLVDRWPDIDAHGQRIWREVRKTTKCSDGFLKMRLVLQRAGIVEVGRAGDAELQWMESRALVREAAALLSREPTALLCDDPDCVHCPTSRSVLASWSAPARNLSLLD